MTWTTTTLERKSLYDQIWATPVSKLAKSYGLSDVRLRKICISLDIPLPPRGYWAKLAFGKTVPRAALHETNGPTTYNLSTYLREVDHELEKRLEKARANLLCDAIPGQDSPSVEAEPQQFTRGAKVVRTALKGKKPQEGVLSTIGETWADISVSPALTERAFSLLDIFAHELNRFNAEFENSRPASRPPVRGARRSSEKRNCFSLHGQEYFIRIFERITKELVPPPPARARNGNREPAWDIVLLCISSRQAGGFTLR